MTSQPRFKLEQSTKSAYVVGIDEAGCGPWAGPVIVAAVMFPKAHWDYIEKEFGLNDSKKLSSKRREVLFEHITHVADFGIAEASVEEIDLYNIVGAVRLATHRAISKLNTVPEVALIDGIRNPKLEIFSHMIKKGDEKSCSIAAASILAKVTRDRYMAALGERYPAYEWHKNAGYGTKAHQNALYQYGVTPYHRKTYAPIRRLLEDGHDIILNSTDI